MKTAASILLGGVVLLLVAALVVGGCAYSGYNQAIKLDESVHSQWSQVENQLQRRYDLIPNLVETVKGAAGQEQTVFLGIAEARKAYFQAGTVARKAEAASSMESALSRLLVFSEQYPQLRSSEAFTQLQAQIEGTENRLAVERMRYNEAVKQLNIFIRQPLGRIYARLAGVESAEYFEVSEAAQSRPDVKF